MKNHCGSHDSLIFYLRVTWIGPAVTLHDTACCCRPPARLARARWTTRTVWRGSEMVTGHPTLSHWNHAENMRGWLRLRIAQVLLRLSYFTSTKIREFGVCRLPDERPLEIGVAENASTKAIFIASAEKRADT